MEKRALLAFAISMLIVTIWSMWVSPPPTTQRDSQRSKELLEERETPPPEAASSTDQGESSTRSASLSMPTEVRPATSAPERIITVDGPLYQAKISTRGGRLLSWRLKGYRESLDPSSPPIDLIESPPESVPFPLALRVDGRLDSLLNETVLDFGTEEIVHVPPQGQLRLKGVASLPNGIVMTKEMIFFGDRYTMDLIVSLQDANGRSIARAISLLWPHINVKRKNRWAGFAGPVTFADNDFSEIKDVEELKGQRLEVDWAGYALKYFLSAIIPLNPGRKLLTLEPIPQGTLLILSQGIGDGAPQDARYTLYLGPKTLEDLKAAGHHLDQALDFGFFGLISKPLLLLLIGINKFTHNYGIAIIVLTILIKLLFWPLTHKSYASMKEMQRIQPRIKQIRERFKNDREQMNREMMLLYKTHKVNPMSGCLPMLLQIPVFFALYKALLDSIELRHSPFCLWIKDLAAPDYLLKFPAGVNIFGIEGIGPLPLLMGLSMLIQQKMTPTMGDPTQAKLMMFMPIFFTFLFISFPSGLVLYWLINNVLSIVQQVYIQARLE